MQCRVQQFACRALAAGHTLERPIRVRHDGQWHNAGHGNGHQQRVPVEESWRAVPAHAAQVVKHPDEHEHQLRL